MWTLSMEQVVALAPDEKSVAAGKKLGGPKPWKGTGRNDAALWGECQGSAVYQTKIDLAELAYNCSCPSRKLPCKHVLGLLMLAAASPEAVAEAEPPEWVATWLAKRAARSQAREEKRAAQAPPDPAAQAKRAADRHERVLAGLAELDLWLDDVARGGLAGVEVQPPSFWERQAKRLVDAQAPALAARVRRLGEIPGAGDDWPRRLLEHLGRLALLSHAYQRLDRLEPNLRQEVRQLAGWSMTREEVLAAGEPVRDRWLIVGQIVEDEERLRAQRAWLLGVETRRAALVLQFSAAGQPFAEALVPGAEIDADLAFYPGNFPHRALIAARRESGPMREPPPGRAALEELWNDMAAALARQPWLDRFLWVLHDARLAPRPDEGWAVCDRTGAAAPLAPRGQWTALALSGGRPCDLAGEWDGRALRLLGAFAEGMYHPLAEAE